MKFSLPPDHWQPICRSLLIAPDSGISHPAEAQAEILSERTINLFFIVCAAERARDGADINAAVLPRSWAVSSTPKSFFFV
jgi:hypothetical protein